MTTQRDRHGPAPTRTPAQAEAASRIEHPPGSADDDIVFEVDLDEWGL